MNTRRKRSLVRSGFLAACAALAIGAIAIQATAGTSASATSVAPGSIKADSANVSVFGVALTTDAADQLTAAKVTLNSISGFTTGDLAPTTGVSLWRDSSTTGSNQDSLDAADTQVSTNWTAVGGDCSVVPSCTASMTVPSTAIPTAAEGAYTFLIAVRTSNTISNGNSFNVAVTTDSFTTSPAATLAVPATTSNIVADTVAPVTPTVSALGLSKAAGKVRVGGTAVSGENPGVLEVWRDSDTACLGGSKVAVAESASTNLGQTNADLVGTTEEQTAAIQGIAAGQTVCYRVRDAAGNVSSYTADGSVPAAPTTADTALLGVRNVTGAKKVSALADTTPGRTFRLYLRPGGSGLERAKDQNLVTPTAVEVTTAAGVAESSSTDVRQWGNNATLAAADGVAYSRVNSNGNDGAVFDDGTIPAVPAAEELDLLSTSAADGHQRTISAPDTLPGRIYGLYLDPAGLTSWQRAVTTSGGTTPVRVTTASTSAASPTTDIFAGTSGLDAGFAAGFARVDGNGNESAVAANGTIPAAPVAGNITYSDALNQFTVSPFPLSVEVGAYAGSDAASSYDGTPEGIATSSAPASIGELASGLNLFYSAVNTATGNESKLTADGSVPGVPAAADVTLLQTSAADGHKRLIAGTDDVSPGRTFRLYIDTAGGSSFVRSSTLSGGSLPVEVTTDGNGSSSTGGTVFAGTTALDGGHAVGYAVVVGGNDSDVAADGAIPAAVVPTTTSVSDALNNFVATSATAALPVNLHLGGAGDSASVAYSESLNGAANPDGSAASAAPVSISEPNPNSTVYYTVTNAATGNESTTVGDGEILGSPGSDLAILGVSAAQGHQRITASSDSAGPRTIRLYVDPAGGSAWTRAATTSGGSTPVEVNTVNGSASSSPTTDIYAGTTPLAAGHAVGHSRVTPEGNDSDVAGDQTIPSAPIATSSFATAAIDEVTSTEASATNNIPVYKSSSPSAATAYDGSPNVTLDATTTKTLDATGGDYLYYTKVNTGSGNESVLTDDGVIPAAPSASGSGASARTDTIVVPDATASNNVLIYLDANSTPATAYGNGEDYTAASSPFAGTDLPAQFLFYVAKNVTSGNESEITSDGNIPGAPTGVDGAMTASAAEQRISSSNDSSSRTVRLYGDPAGLGSYVAATTTATGSDPVEITTSTGSQVVSEQGIYLNGSPLGAGATIAYGRILDGNESEIVTDGSIPAAPSGVANFAADATDGTATIGSAATTGTYRAFRGATSASDRADHTSGTPTTITVTGLAGGDVPGYAITLAGNESPVLADGTIPNAPAIDLQNASDLGRLSTDGITTDAIPTFDVSTTPAADVTLLEGATVHDTGAANGSGLAVLSADALSDGLHSLKAKVTVGGNTSPSSSASDVTVDTVAPATPGAPDLVDASDTGVSNADNLTRDTTPSFGASVEAGADTLLFAGASQVASTIADGTGATSLNSSALTDGTYGFTLQAVDVAGNSSAPSPALSVEIDSAAQLAAPTAVLQAASDTGRSVTDGVTNDTTPSLDVTGADAGSSLVLLEGTTELATGTADGSGNATLTSSALAIGSHGLTVEATDPAGNASDPSSVTTVVVDTIAPVAPDAPTLSSDTGRSVGDGITNVSTPAFAVQTEALGIVELVEGEFSRGSATADNSGVAGPAVSSALVDGPHSITARVTDVAGNLSLESPATDITVDTVAPATPGAPDLLDASDTGSSVSDNNTTDTTPAFALSVEPDATAQLFAGASQVASDIADGTGAATLTSVAVSHGSYGFAVKAVDVAGNESVLSPELSVEIDTIAPVAPPAAVLQAASDTGRSVTDGETSDNTPSLDVSGAGAGASLELRSGGDTLAVATADGSGNATFTTPALADGSHSLSVSSLDAAGNTSEPSSVTAIVVDTIAPAVPGAPALSSETGRSLTDGITSNATPAFAVTTEALARIDLMESGSSIGSAIADGSGAAAPAVGSSLAEGVHSVTAKATDVAGNSSAESSATSVTVDTVAPVAPVSVDLQTASDSGSSTTDNLTKINTPTFTVLFAEASGLVKLYDDTALQSATAIGDASVPISSDTLADGAHPMKATVSDLAGNESAATTPLGVTIDTVVPATPATPDLDVNSDTGSSGTDNVTGDATPVFNLAGGEAGTTLALFEGVTQHGAAATVAGNGTASVTSDALADGVHTVVWRLTDVAGNISASSAPLNVTIDTGAPSVQQLTTTSALTGVFKAKFSEDMSSPTINTSTVVLRVTGTTVNIPSMVTYDSPSKTATLKPKSPLVAGQRYTLTVGPTSVKPADKAGSAINPGTASASVRASVIEQELTVGGKQLWAVVSNSAASGGSYTTERLNGATASFTFSGTSVTWTSLLGPDQGKARVLIDGSSKGDFDNYKSTAQFKYARTFAGLSSGSHTIKVIALGTKNPSATNTRVVVDAFKVGSTTYEHASFTFLWQSVVAKPSSAGRYIRSDVAGTMMNFTFRGTGIDWMTITGPNMGKALVTIDGISVGTVDNYASSFRYGVLRSYRGLSDGVHMIRITVLGQRSSSSTGSFVAVDKFQVQ